MNTLPPEPSAKDQISATFIKALMRYIRANTLLNGPGYKTKRGPNGTTLELKPSKGVSSSPAAKIPGRFEITLTPDEIPEGSEPEEQTYTATFRNPYYDIGGKTYEMTAEGESDAVTLEGIKDGSIIFIKISAKGSETEAELGTFTSLVELKSEQENKVDYYTIPLYKVQGGSIACDFRTGPISAMWEA